MSSQPNNSNHSRELIIWLITDEKPGHQNQLRGLLQRLQYHHPVKANWIKIKELPVSWKDLFKGAYPHQQGEAPDMVIAAGHRTHRHLLTIKKHFNCFGVVLMKPSLPLGFFDAAIIPAHDKPKNSTNILITQGVINTVSPSPAVKSHSDLGLILVGGPSKHYQWDSQGIVEQVLQLCQEQSGRSWLLTDSRRTPADCLTPLKQNCPNNLTIVPHQETTPQWLPEQLSASHQTWVTPDSVSMVYEALTANRPTGIFNLPSGNKKNRIVKGINDLVSEGLLVTFDQRDCLHDQVSNQGLWEADRAAVWLLKQYFDREVSSL